MVVAVQSNKRGHHKLERDEEKVSKRTTTYNGGALVVDFRASEQMGHLSIWSVLVWIATHANSAQEFSNYSEGSSKGMSY